MPYVQRTPEGKITGVYSLKQPGLVEEFLDDNNAEVIEYLHPPPRKRVIDSEDIWAFLESKAIATPADRPSDVADPTVRTPGGPPE